MRDVSSPAALETRTTSVSETRELAAAVAKLIRPGDVLVLGGDLGAGKTAFTQGLGAALGVQEPMVSPTFTIERIYDADLRLHHLDVYRLEHLHEALDLGLDEALDDGDVLIVEWGEAISGVLGGDHLLVRLALADGDTEREVTFAVHGARWEGRAGELAEAVEPWRLGRQPISGAGRASERGAGS